jgi:hypothetical protein
MGERSFLDTVDGLLVFTTGPVLGVTMCPGALLCLPGLALAGALIALPLVALGAVALLAGAIAAPPYLLVRGAIRRFRRCDPAAARVRSRA